MILKQKNTLAMKKIIIIFLKIIINEKSRSHITYDRKRE